MALQHVKGNTWVYEGVTALMPVYMVAENEAVLIDTGFAARDREGLTALFDGDIHLKGIICTHAHFDHSGNVRYLAQRYGAVVAAPLIEAGIAVNTESYRANYIGLTYRNTEELFPEECFSTDILIRPNDAAVAVAGAEFTVFPLPGHSAGHTGIATPDNVLYVGDCILDRGELSAAKLPTSMFIARDLESKAAVGKSRFDAYILAHKSVVWEMASLAEENIAFYYKKRAEILSCLRDGMTLAQWLDVFCQKVNIRTRSTLKFAIIERNFSNFVSWMIDEGIIEIRRECCAKTYYRTHI